MATPASTSVPLFRERIKGSILFPICPQLPLPPSLISKRRSLWKTPSFLAFYNKLISFEIHLSWTGDERAQRTLVARRRRSQETRAQKLP